MEPDENYMKEAIRLSSEAVTQGSYPYGACLVYEQQVIVRGYNTVLTDGDISAHAELNVIREACRHFPQEVLKASSLYTSTECCAMCAGAVYWAGIPRVVYGCPTAVDGKISMEPFAVPMMEVLRYSDRDIEIIGPVLEEEAVAVLQTFWRGFLARTKSPE